jgi:hypothetical protein
MERSLLTWSIPNMITIWLMLIALVVVYALGAQAATSLGWIGGSSSTPANNSGGY